MEQSEIIETLKQRLSKAFAAFEGDLATIRTGRAKPDLVGNLVVEVYGGQKMKLMELANIAAPSTDLIVLSPWDKSVIASIEKAINESDLSLSANVSGEMIRVPIPPLTEERRKDFVKLLHQKIESGRVMVRQVREEIKKEIDEMKGKPGVSEDDIVRLHEQMQLEVDGVMEKLEGRGRQKEEELMAV